MLSHFHISGLRYIIHVGKKFRWAQHTVLFGCLNILCYI